MERVFCAMLSLGRPSPEDEVFPGPQGAKSSKSAVPTLSWLVTCLGHREREDTHSLQETF